MDYIETQDAAIRLARDIIDDETNNGVPSLFADRELEVFFCGVAEIAKARGVLLSAKEAAFGIAAMCYASKLNSAELAQFWQDRFDDICPLKEKTDESILLDTLQTNIGTLEVYAGAMPKTPDAPKPGAVVHCEPVSPSDGDGDDFIRACYDRDAMMQQILNNTKERIVMSQELVVMSQELGMYYYRDKVDKQAPGPKTESFAEALAAANRKVGC